MSTDRNAILGRISALGAAAAYGISAILIREGVGELTLPLVGAAISLLSGTVVTSITGTQGLRDHFIKRRRDVIFLLISGVAAALGILASFFALSMARVVIVSPIQSTSPLFALLLAHFFLGKMERITLRLVMGTVLVIVGVSLITYFRVA